MKKHFKAKKVVRSGETTDLTEGIFESLNAGTKRIYQRQSHIDYETQQLNENAEEFGRQSILWMQMIQDMRSAIQVKVFYATQDLGSHRDSKIWEGNRKGYGQHLKPFGIDRAEPGTLIDQSLWQ
eukprot:TRINITY_DN3384_c0_g1_i3.p1 TRINITY_DN3384_c0_g1~~TRINITY_DN3384_c0_g1_i3.p1  ORF type:complete len:137 (-),score=22.08 TRINITY_DN3384_c0_g1_i3:78-452(-)